MAESRGKVQDVGKHAKQIRDVLHFDGVCRWAPFPFFTRKMFDNMRHCDYNGSIDVSRRNAA